MWRHHIGKTKAKKTEWEAFLSPKKLLSLLAALATPILYLNGYYYDRGYIDTFGIIEGLANRTNSYIFFANNAYIVQATSIVESALKNWGFFAAFSIFIFFTNIVISWIIHKKYDIEASKLRKRLKDNKIISCIIQSATISSFTFVGLIYFFVFIAAVILLTMWPYFEGRSDAQKQINSFKECERDKPTGKQTCYFLYKEDKLVASGINVLPSDGFIFLYNGANVELYGMKDYRVVIQRQFKTQ